MAQPLVFHDPPQVLELVPLAHLSLRPGGEALAPLAPRPAPAPAPARLFHERSRVLSRLQWVLQPAEPLILVRSFPKPVLALKPREVPLVLDSVLLPAPRPRVHDEPLALLPHQRVQSRRNSLVLLAPPRLRVRDTPLSLLDPWAVQARRGPLVLLTPQKAHAHPSARAHAVLPYA